MTQSQRSQGGIRVFLGIALVAALAAATLEYIPSGSPVKWRSYASALEEAERTGLPIYVDIYAQWCGPCKEMDMTTYSDDTVRGLFSTLVIPARINIDDPFFTDSMKTAWRIKAVPTSLILSADGREIRRRVGYMNRSAFVVWLGDSALMSFGSWRTLADARNAAAQLRKPLLVVVGRTRENAEDVGRFFADSTILGFVTKNFIPTYVTADETPAFQTIQMFLTSEHIPARGMVLNILSPDMNMRGQLAVPSEDFGDVARIRQSLERYVISP